MYTENIYVIAQQVLARSGWREAIYELQQRFPELSKDIIETIVISMYGMRLSLQLRAEEVAQIKWFRSHFPNMRASDLAASWRSTAICGPSSMWPSSSSLEMTGRTLNLGDACCLTAQCAHSNKPITQAPRRVPEFGTRFWVRN